MGRDAVEPGVSIGESATMAAHPPDRLPANSGFLCDVDPRRAYRLNKPISQKYNKRCLLSSHKGIEVQQDSLGFLLGDVSRLLRRAFQHHMEGSPLTLAQARALVHIARHEGVRQVDLAETLEVQPITLARLIDQLTASGVVERRADANDRRAYRVFLTPGAAPHLAAIEEAGAAIRTIALQDMDQQQAATLFLALAKMRDNLGSR